MTTTISEASTGWPIRPLNRAAEYDLLSMREFRELVEVLRLRDEPFFVIEFCEVSRNDARSLLTQLRNRGDQTAVLGWLGRDRLGVWGQETRSIEALQQRAVHQTPPIPITRVFVHGRLPESSLKKKKVGLTRSIRVGDRGQLSCFADSASAPARAIERKRFRRRKREVHVGASEPAQSAGQPHRIGQTSFPVCELYKIPTPLGKRCFDVVFATLALVLVSPLLCLAVVLIKSTSRGPLFFVQDRVGHGGRPFRIYKLRTMHVDADGAKNQLREQNEMNGSAFKMRCDPRVTRVGKLLRRFSIDEVPQLWNVIRGDMSLVGPRPLPIADWAPESVRESLRHDVAPGLTCIWQVMGRNEIGWEDWVRMDLFYVRKRCWVLDIKILLGTVPAVISQRGAL